MVHELISELDQYHLLTHPFYQMWTKGALSQEVIRDYAKQYYHHVDAFPRYISAIHTQCNNIEDRQILLGNLMDEELGEDNHPALWLKFAEALGAQKEEVKGSTLYAETKHLIDGFFNLARKSYACGLGALFAYERQVPEVAKSKIEGLKAHYKISSKEALHFFEVHISADEWHSTECADLIEKLPEEERQEARQGAIEAAKLLYGFLDGVMHNNNLKCEAA